MRCNWSHVTRTLPRPLEIYVQIACKLEPQLISACAARLSPDKIGRLDRCGSDNRPLYSDVERIAPSLQIAMATAHPPPESVFEAIKDYVLEVRNRSARKARVILILKFHVSNASQAPTYHIALEATPDHVDLVPAVLLKAVPPGIQARSND